MWERVVRPRTSGADSPAPQPPSELLTQFVNARLVTAQGSTELGEVWVLGSRFADPRALFWQRGEAKHAADHRVDCSGMLLAPGFIDCQAYEACGVHFGALGSAGAEAEAAAREAMRRVRRSLPRHGVTAFCPTVGACDPAVCGRLLSRLGAPRGANEALAVGVHLDGPFHSREHLPATDDASYVRDAASAAALLEACGVGADGPPPRGGVQGAGAQGGESRDEQAFRALGSSVAIVTLAPEIPGAVPLTRALCAAGVVVGIGRTAASLSQCGLAVGCGARLVTSLLSQMPPFKHRDPGPLGLLVSGGEGGDGDGGGGVAGGDGGAGGVAVGVADGGAVGEGVGVYYTLPIGGDGDGVHDATINLARSTCPEGLVVVSPPHRADGADGARANGATNGVHVANGGARVAEAAACNGGDDEEGEGEGGMAASVRRLWRCSGEADPAAAILCASAHPAALLGLPSKGSLAAGADADFVLLDAATLRVRATYVAGELAWAHPDLKGSLWYQC